MPIILVTDDSELDRRLIGGILQSEDGFEVEYAENGAQALAKMECEIPDLIVSDIQMPELDGLELVKAVRKQYRGVPVILTTARGSEHLAVEALRAGAASYVPKKLLSHDLLRTVRDVLAICERQAADDMLLRHTTSTQSEFELDNDLEYIAPLVRHLLASLAFAGGIEDAEHMRVGVALREAIVYAMCQGNLEVDPGLLSGQQEQFFALVAERAKQAPYSERRVRVQWTLSAEGVRIVVRHEGAPAEAALLQVPLPENMHVANMRGIVLMRAFMDEIELNDDGNEVTMLKKPLEDLDELIVADENEDQ